MESLEQIPLAAAPINAPGSVIDGGPGSVSHQTACLVCGGQPFKTGARWTGRQVRLLYEEFGLLLAPEDLAPVADDTGLEMWQCRACGFRFFDPAFAGAERFYAALEQKTYYVSERPEFGFALAEAARRGVRNVLDVGGGDGAFLDCAERFGLKTFGLELNAAAAGRAAVKGHQMLSRRAEELEESDFPGGLDLITLFHVLEHLPDPIGFLRSLSRLLRPGGCLILSVPNDRGVRALCPHDPANLPPHHVSRWRLSDLRHASDRAGLHFAGNGADRLFGSMLRDFWLLHNRLAARLGDRPHWGGSLLPRAVSWFYRKLGCRFFFPRLGLSIYAVLEKRAA